MAFIRNEGRFAKEPQGAQDDKPGGRAANPSLGRWINI
jgi:hypothetical protein